MKSHSLRSQWRLPILTGLASTLLFGLLVGFAASAPSVSASPTPVVVNHSGQAGWNAYALCYDPTYSYTVPTDPSDTVDFVTGPATPPLGVGSVELTTGVGSPAGGTCTSEVRNSDYAGVKLADLTTLSYWTYDSINNGSQFPYLRLDVSYTGGSDSLFFEPPYQVAGAGNADCAHQAAEQIDTWQSWDAVSGCWWDNNNEIGGGGTNTDLLSTFISLHPDATIVNAASTKGGVRLAVGYGSTGDEFQGYVDAVTIGTSSSKTEYNFEPAPPVPTSTNQCKSGGWSLYADASGTPFKNQGDCVSYVATGGRNPGNG